MSVGNRRAKTTFNLNVLKETMRIIRMILDRMVTLTREEIIKLSQKNGVKQNS